MGVLTAHAGEELTRPVRRAEAVHERDTSSSHDVRDLRVRRPLAFPFWAVSLETLEGSDLDREYASTYSSSFENFIDEHRTSFRLRVQALSAR